ncbi:MAG: glycosyl hydrolase, partial [Deltaproteobacteria bacterium]|nr:glycosyl hydrolase [Deltaproteobacteria bacterium]
IHVPTGEVTDIQPQAGKGEPHERFNWDAPILVSPHQPTRIYFGSQRVWRSDDRGDSWQAISGDLTRDQERLDLPIMGQTQSWDNPWDVSAMSNYNTITSLAESPLQEGLIWAGTDDGLLQLTTDGGETWRAIEAKSLPGVPETAFVNDIKASLHDAETVFIALDNHKYGDYDPYLLMSTDSGRSWKAIRGNLPDRTIVWRVVQDHVRESLLFAGTEFGIYFTVDFGETWTRLEGGMPTISIRDLAIQRRESDLVAASFGRGFYVLDDLSVLREVTDEQLASPAALFSTRKAWWYIPRPHLGFEEGKGDQGAAHFIAPNPPFGAVFTYHLREDLKTAKEARQEREKTAMENQEAVQFPGWETVEDERREPEPKVWLIVKNADGEVVRRLGGAAEKGFHRVAWDLRYPRPDALRLAEPPPPMWGGPPRGLMAAPGTFTVTLASQVDGEVTELATPISFEVEPLHDSGALEGADPATVAAFWREYESAVRVHTAMGLTLEKLLARVDRMQVVLGDSRADAALEGRIHDARAEVLSIDEALNGNRSRGEVGEKNIPTVSDRLFTVSLGVGRSTYGPTSMHRESLAIAQARIREIHARIESIQEEVADLGRALIDAWAPWLEDGELPTP